MQDWHSQLADKPCQTASFRSRVGDREKSYCQLINSHREQFQQAISYLAFIAKPEKFGERWSDLDLHVLVDLARSGDPLYLLVAEKKLARLQAEISSDLLPDYTLLERGILSNFYQQAGTDGPLSLIPLDIRSPSLVVDTAWLLAIREPGHFPNYGRAGKWMIFPTHPEVDALWLRVAEATREGRLGPLSKVSTAKPVKRPHKHEHVVQVYTDNKENQADISRVSDVLRTLGATQRLPYGPGRRARPPQR